MTNIYEQEESDFTNLDYLIELESRGLNLRCIKICEEIIEKNKKIYPKLNLKEINKKSRKEIFAEIRKETELLRVLRIKTLIS